MKESKLNVQPIDYVSAYLFVCLFSFLKLLKKVGDFQKKFSLNIVSLNAKKSPPFYP